MNCVNELKRKRTQLDIWETIFYKFYQNRPGSFGVLARTDRQTDTRTDRQTDTRKDRQIRSDNAVFSNPNDPITLGQ